MVVKTLFDTMRCKHCSFPAGEFRAEKYIYFCILLVKKKKNNTFYGVGYLFGTHYTRVCLKTYDRAYFYYFFFLLLFPKSNQSPLSLKLYELRFIFFFFFISSCNTKRLIDRIGSYCITNAGLNFGLNIFGLDNSYAIITTTI